MTIGKRGLASVRRKPCTYYNQDIPKTPGVYYWIEWGENVEVIKRGKHLYVTPPIAGGIEVRVSGRIAGHFLPAR